MKSINFVVLGEQSIADEFGKKGTKTDITLYDRKESDIIRTWIVPNGFPDKIPPLFQAINLGEYVIFYVGSLDKFTGEQIIALDVLKKREGILSHTYEVDENRLTAMIKGTVLEQYRLVNSSDLKQILNKLDSISKEGKTKIIIDHCFDVKGVGTVVLGKVTQGKVKQYDALKLLPAGLDVVVKSIQMHDDPVSEAASPARVGLSLKGVKPDEINRGDILCEDSNIYQLKSEIELDFKKNPFYKGEISENQMCLVNIDMQIKAAKFVSANPVKLRLDKPAVFDNDICVILKPDSENIRILGSGTMR
jgi:selenocysteine-specific translation elongation factor